jgi:hypothetical protein
VSTCALRCHGVMPMSWGIGMRALHESACAANEATVSTAKAQAAGRRRGPREARYV